MKSISKELQGMMSACMQYKVQVFLERVDTDCFPKAIRPLVSLIGIDRTLQICLLTTKLRIPKKEATLQRNPNNPIYQILLSLPTESRTLLLMQYRGCQLNVPRFTTVWNRTLKRAGDKN
jgi:hypothetical protein